MLPRLPWLKEQNPFHILTLLNFSANTHHPDIVRSHHHTHLLTFSLPLHSIRSRKISFVLFTAAKSYLEWHIWDILGAQVKQNCTNLEANLSIPRDGINAKVFPALFQQDRMSWGVKGRADC